MAKVSNLCLLAKNCKTSKSVIQSAARMLRRNNTWSIERRCVTLWTQSSHRVICLSKWLGHLDRQTSLSNHIKSKMKIKTRKSEDSRRSKPSTSKTTTLTMRGWTKGALNTVMVLVSESLSPVCSRSCKKDAALLTSGSRARPCTTWRQEVERTSSLKLTSREAGLIRGIVVKCGRLLKASCQAVSILTANLISCSSSICRVM